MIKLYGYKACGTVKKAEKALQAMQVEYQFIDITQTPPTKEELSKAISLSSTPIAKAFNTSGVVYKEGNYKDKINGTDEDTLLNWLCGNGKLIKRPVILDENRASIGFKDGEFQQTWGAKS